MSKQERRVLWILFTLVLITAVVITLAFAWQTIQQNNQVAAAEQRTAIQQRQIERDLNRLATTRALTQQVGDG